ncbi:hypothetical protein [Streptomyces sp. NPDC008092]|uniref:hypothetical protein n=1 Tax=Streptomyces sp. NPDC008092 TaxID=3364808 RepID=UPI0036E6EE75
MVAGVVAAINVMVEAATAANLVVRVLAILLLVVAGFFAGTLFHLVKGRPDAGVAAPRS